MIIKAFSVCTTGDSFFNGLFLTFIFLNFFHSSFFACFHILFNSFPQDFPFIWEKNQNEKMYNLNGYALISDS